MELSFVTLDVFTDTRFEGNPLAVVSIPTALKDKVSQTLKLKITREFNLSETVFLHESDDANAKELQIDIFTIGRELVFAGHPTIGTAVLVKHHLNPLVDTLVTKAGPIGLVTSSDGSRFIRAKIPHNVHVHEKTLNDVLPQKEVQAYPGLSHWDTAIRDAEIHAPVFSCVKGMTFVLVKLSSLELLGKVKASGFDFDGLPVALLDSEWSPSFTARYYYVDLGTVDGKRSLRTRMTEIGFEDPATGSAASALAGYLTVAEKSTGIQVEVVQGIEMGRRSVISVETKSSVDEAGNVSLKELWLGGEAVVVTKGSLVVE